MTATLTETRPARLATSALGELIADLDTAVRDAPPGRPRVDAVCTALRPYLGRRDLLRPEHRIGNPAAYRQHVLRAADDGAFSLVALVWLPGQATPIHDHVTWCVVRVHEGAEYETRYELSNNGHRLVQTGTAYAGVGSVTGLLLPGDIHKVDNSGATLAISLHVYGVGVGMRGTSIRRRYDQQVIAALRGSHVRSTRTDV